MRRLVPARGVDARTGTAAAEIGMVPCDATQAGPPGDDVADLCDDQRSAARSEWAAPSRPPAWRTRPGIRLRREYIGVPERRRSKCPIKKIESCERHRGLANLSFV